MTRGPGLVFSTPAYAYLGERVCRAGRFDAGRVERQTFPDGERYQRIASSVEGRDVALLGGTSSDAACLDLFDLACGLVKEGCRTLAIVIPYFGYSTMERASRRGEVVAAKNRARLLSAIPLAPNGTRVALLDLHAEGITHYFEGGLVPTHLYAKPLVLAAAREYGGRRFVMACVDSGRAKWVESLANDLRVPVSFVFKRRLDGRRTEVVAVSADVRGKAVVIYDDMIRTGGSLLAAARAYRDAGAKRITAIATHGVFAEGSLAELEGSRLFDRLVVTDSHPAAVAAESRFVTVARIAPLLVEYLQGAHP